MGGVRPVEGSGRRAGFEPGKGDGFRADRAHLDEVLGLLPNVDALVPPVGFLVVEVLEPLDGAQAVPELAGHVLRALRHEELHHRQRLVHVSPLVVATVETVPQRLHDEIHVLAVARRARELGEVLAVRAPRVAVGALERLDFDLRQARHLVLGLLRRSFRGDGRPLQVLHRRGEQRREVDRSARALGARAM